MFQNKFKIIFINIILVVLVVGILISAFYSYRYSQLETKIQASDSFVSCDKYQNNDLEVFKLVPNSICYCTDKYNGKVVKKTKIIIDSNGFRRTQDDFDKSKSRMVVFGCSFAFGYRIADNETFAWRLSELTHRKVYNVSYSGEGLQHMLLSLQSEDFWKKIPDSDTFVYVFIKDHFRRLKSPTNLGDGNFYPTYKLLPNGRLVANKPSKEFINADFDGRKRLKKLSYIASTGYESADPNLRKLFIAILKESQSIIKEKRPNAKFIILDIESDSEIADLFRSNGFDVVSVSDLLGTRYYTNKYMVLNNHPNAEFWKVLTPKFVEYEKL